MGTKYIHLIRHGQYHMDDDHKKHGSLTSLGRYQAQRVANRLNQYDVSMVHVSTMTRAQETGALIVERLDSSKCRNCKFIVEGIPEFSEAVIRQKKFKKTRLKKTKARMNQAFKKYFTPYKGRGEKHEALVCHGNIIRYFVAKALGIDTSKWVNFEIFQCSITTVKVGADGKSRLVTFGEIGHIPPKKRTHF